MSLYTILVFVLLAILGALIAYLGDVIGTRVGKQRSSVFGLRPRQSARLVAAIIGGLLPLLGLGVATVGSRYAYTAVFELRTLIDQRKQLAARIDSLQEEVDRYEERARSAEDRAEQAEETAVELKGIQEQQQERIESLQSHEAQLQQRSAALQERVRGLSGRVEELTARRDELQSELRGAREGLQRSREELRQAEQSLDVTKDELEQKRREVAQKEKRVEVIGLQYDNVQAELQSVNRELSSAQAELTTTSDELAAMEQQVASMEQELAAMESRLQHVIREQDLVSRSAEGLFEPGYELLRVVQWTNKTQDQVEADLMEWLHLASAVAERRGVPEGPSGRAVVLVAPIPPGTQPGEASEGEIIADVARKLRTESPQEWVVMVRAFRRFFPEFDDQLSVHFQATPNELEFPEGAVLDEFVLAPNGDEQRIGELEAIQTLWHRVADSDSPVRVRAIAEGMLPRPNTDSYGAIDLAAIYEAAQEIIAIEGSVLVRLKAAGDTYTRGPLELTIEVRPAGEAS